VLLVALAVVLLMETMLVLLNQLSVVVLLHQVLQLLEL
jgi:hypothetical protein